MTTAELVYSLIVLIQLFYFLGLFSRFTFSKSKTPTPKNIGISVLVCAKNEAENLKKCIPAILNQDYADFELILVNDNSSDDTLEVMKKFEKVSHKVRIVDVAPVDTFWNNKKYPLTLGIKAASNDYLLFTDADCVPASKDWIKLMSAHFSNDKTIILGYGAYEKIKGSILNAMIRFETVFTAIQYMSYALSGNPYMGVGRNLSYRKDLFFKADGFKSHMHLRSGDDDLFINQVADSENTEVCSNSDAFTISLPHTTFRGWINQKKRHVSTSGHYRFKHKFLLGTFYLSQIAFWIASIILLIFNPFSYVLLGLFLLRVLTSTINLSRACLRFKEKDLIIFTPLLEFSLVILQLVIFISNRTSRSNHWR